jgi:hypothetical protein
VTSVSDDPTNDLPPEHPAAADAAVGAGDALSDREWRGDANVQQNASVPPSTDREPDVPGREPAEGRDDVPPAPDRDADRDRGAGSDAASDVEQFLDIDPPASPATDADIPAPPG